MKNLILLSFAFIFFLSLNAQTPNYNIVVRQSTNGDTLLMDLLGVISGPTPRPNSPLPDITPQLQDIGVTTIRNNDYRDDKLDMEALFRCDTVNDTVPSWGCSPEDMNNYHFEASDSLYRAIKNGGFKLFFRLGGETQSALSNQFHISHGPQDTIAENNWIQAAIKVVEHYDNFEGTPNRLDYLDIWTEWPNQDFWERNNDQFIWFYTKALDTLKSHFPDKKVGGPGFLVPTVQVIDSVVNNKATDLLTSLYLHNIKPDFISWHLWQMSPESYYLAGENFRKLLDGTPPFSSVPWAGTGFFDGVEIICGAWGTPQMTDDGIPLSDHQLYLLFNKQKGAALFTADWIAMQETNTVKAFYYTCSDATSNPDTTIGDIGWSGLFYGDTDVTYKPKAYAFKLWSKIYNEFPQKLSCDFPVYASDSSKLWVLAAKNSQNAYALLISNTDSIVKTFTISIQGQTIDTSNFNIFYYIVNDNENGDITHQSFDNNFSIAEQTVEFIRILPKDYTISNNKNSKIKIYPNPTTNFVRIENIKDYNVIVTNVLGEEVYQTNQIKTNSIIIYFSNFSQGFYFIKCYNNKGESQNFKIIKK